MEGVIAGDSVDITVRARSTSIDDQGSVNGHSRDSEKKKDKKKHKHKKEKKEKKSKKDKRSDSR